MIYINNLLTINPLIIFFYEILTAVVKTSLNLYQTWIKLIYQLIKNNQNDTIQLIIYIFSYF